MSNDHIAGAGEKVPEMNESDIDNYMELLVRAIDFAVKKPGLEIDNLCKAAQHDIKKLIDDVIKSRVCDNCDNYGWILKKCMLFDEMLDNPERQSCTEFLAKKKPAKGE